MSINLDEQLIQRYINHRRAYSNNQKNLEESLEKFWASLESRFKAYPNAKRFLMDQKDMWHKNRLLSLKQMGLEKTEYECATLFLELLTPNNDKQKALKRVLKEWYEQTTIILGAVSRIKVAEDGGVRNNSYPVGVVSGDGQLLEFSLSAEKTREAYKIVQSDKEFITYYRRKAEAYWCLQSGLWPYTYKPAELQSHERLMGSPCEVFYTGVSDFLLCMTETLKNTEIVLMHHGENWFC